MSVSKVAIVTGAGSGIGRAVALALLANGWRVALAGRRMEPLLETARLAQQADSASLTICADVSQPHSVSSLFDTVVSAWARVDLLFNNAGVGAPSVALEDLSHEQWQRVVDTNLSGMFYCLQNAFRVMKQQTPQGGRIINNGSIAAYAPRPQGIAYTATKHAVTGLTKSANLDGRKYNIAVGQIDIGNAQTDMTQRMERGILQANGQVSVEPVMDVHWVGQSVLHMANLPLEANVLFHTIMATQMPFVGRG